MHISFPGFFSCFYSETISYGVFNSMQQVFKGAELCKTLLDLQRCSQVALSLVGSPEGKVANRSTENEMRAPEDVYMRGG